MQIKNEYYKFHLKDRCKDVPENMLKDIVIEFCDNAKFYMNSIYLCCNELAKKYYKCRYRKCSGSPTTDHRVNWPACGKFKSKDNDSL